VQLTITFSRYSVTTILLYSLAQMPAFAEARQYHIPAGGMNEVLLRISRESGQVITFGPMVDRFRSPAIDGELGPREAVQRVIAGTGLTLEISPSGAFIITSGQVSDGQGANAQLAPINVVAHAGSAMADSLFGDVGFQATQAGSSARLAGANAREIPITINAMTKDVIRSRALTDVSEAIRNMPGVAQASGDPSSPTFTIRGFKSSAIYVNGQGGGGLSDGQIPIEEVERVEVLKGPTSILTGASADGGAINIATKQPTDQKVRELTLGYGSYQQKNLALDLGGPVLDQKNFTYRLSIAGSRADENYAGYKGPYHYLFSPAIKWDDGGTSVLTGMRYYEQKRVPNQNTFIPRTGIDPSQPILHLSRDNPQVNPNLYYKDKTFTPYFNVSHDFGKWGGLVDVMVENNSQFQQSSDEASTFSWLTSRSTRPDLYRMKQNRTGYETQRLINQSGITFKYDGDPIASTTKFGFDYKKLSSSVDSASQAFPFSEINPYTASPRFPLFDPSYNAFFTSNTHSRYRGVYVVEKLDLWSRVHLFGQLRRDKVEKHLENSNGQKNTFDMDGRSWVLGTALDLTDILTIFASKSNGYVPVESTFGSTGAIAPPEQRQQKEVGLRLSLLDDALTVTGSYYELQATNVSICDPVLGCNFSQVVPGQMSKGYELEVQGKPMPGLNITASMGKVDAQYQSANDTFPLAALPRYTGSFWTTYTPQNERFHNFTAGLGATGNTNSKTNSIYTTTQYDVPGDVTLDGLLAYDIDRWSFQFKMNNLLDKYYYRPSYGSSAISIGEGRNFLLQARYSFE